MHAESTHSAMEVGQFLLSCVHVSTDTYPQLVMTKIAQVSMSSGYGRLFSDALCIPSRVHYDDPSSCRESWLDSRCQVNVLRDGLFCAVFHLPCDISTKHRYNGWIQVCSIRSGTSLRCWQPHFSSHVLLRRSLFPCSDSSSCKQVCAPQRRVIDLWRCSFGWRATIVLLQHYWMCHVFVGNPLRKPSLPAASPHAYCRHTMCLCMRVLSVMQLCPRLLPCVCCLGRWRIKQYKRENGV